MLNFGNRASYCFTILFSCSIFHDLFGFVILLRNCLVFAKFRSEANASLRLCLATVERIGRVVEEFYQGHIDITSQGELSSIGKDAHRRDARQSLVNNEPSNETLRLITN